MSGLNIGPLACRRARAALARTSYAASDLSGSAVSATITSSSRLGTHPYAHRGLQRSFTILAPPPGGGGDSSGSSQSKNRDPSSTPRRENIIEAAPNSSSSSTSSPSSSSSSSQHPFAGRQVFQSSNPEGSTNNGGSNGSSNINAPNNGASFSPSAPSTNSAPSNAASNPRTTAASSSTTQILTSTPTSSSSTSSTSNTSSASSSSNNVSGPPLAQPGSQPLSVRPPLLHPFDTHAFVRKVSASGFDDLTAKAFMELTRELVVDSGKRAREGLLHKEDQENAAYLFKAALSELRTELSVRARNDGMALRSTTSLIRREVDALSESLKENIGTLKHDIEMDMNSRKSETRAEQKDYDIAIEDLNNRFTISIGDLKTEIEQAKWEATRRAITIIALLVFTVISVVTLTPENSGSNSKPKPASSSSNESESDAASMSRNGGYSGVDAYASGRQMRDAGVSASSAADLETRRRASNGRRGGGLLGDILDEDDEDGEDPLAKLEALTRETLLGEPSSAGTRPRTRV